MRILKSYTRTQIQQNLSKFSLIKPSQIHHHSRIKLRPNEVLNECVKTNVITKATLLFRSLLRKSTSSIDSFSLLYIIKLCTQKFSPNQGQKQFHTLVVKLGHEPIIFIQTSLVNYYSAEANLVDARQVFDEIPKKNVVCWTALISAYVDNQKPNIALKLFREMQMDKMEPDQVTLTVALSACADLGALDMGKWIHDYVLRAKELNKDLSLYNSLLNMYTKCGDIDTANALFHTMEKKDVTTWTSMIMGYALHGQAREALALFTEMQKQANQTSRTRKNAKSIHGYWSKIVPNDITFIGVLMACSHAGMVEDGKRYFKSMTMDYGLKPRLSHYGCMVDLLCRSGHLKEAQDFILKMSVKPNAVLWRTLLGACSVNGNIDLAKEARAQLLEFEENLTGDDVIMSNIYASIGIWDKKAILRDRISQRRVPGCSSIEVESEINEFVAADGNHQFACKIYEVLESLMGNMRACVYGFDFGE